MSVFYNDFHAPACAILREMMAAGLIGEGVVDERDVAVIQPHELVGYDRVHLFAGIGGFELAARLAGWPDGIQLWTGGFPCQPFSVAGSRRGTADDRYLWPQFHRLLAECRPEFVVVENVPALDGLTDLVLDRVCSDLEGLGYEVAPPLEIPACAVDAAHERNRLWIMAHRTGEQWDDVSSSRSSIRQQQAGERGARPMADGDQSRPQERRGLADDAGQQCPAAERGDTGAVGDAHNQRWLQPGWPVSELGRRPDYAGGGAMGFAEDLGWPARRAGEEGGGRVTSEPWGPSGWIACHDGKFRRLPLGFLDPAVVLADGLPARTAALHGLGNAIVPAVAAQIIRAML